MARFTTVLAALAAVSLTLAPIAAAAQDDEASEDEDASGLPEGSGMVIGLIGVLGLVFLIMAITDDGSDSNDLPDSP